MKEVIHVFVICAGGLASGWIAKDIDCMFNRADVTKPTREPPLAKAQAVNPTGLFRVTGTVDGDDKEYHGTVTILKAKESGSYIVLYTVAVSQFKGVGMLDGTRFVVGWTMDYQGKPLQGVTMYVIDEDGDMHGRYCTVPLSSGKETLKRIPD